MSWGMYARRSHEFDHQHRDRLGPCWHPLPVEKPYDNRLGCAVMYYSDDCIENHHQYQVHWLAMTSMTWNVLYIPDTVIVPGSEWKERVEKKIKHKLDLINAVAISVHFHHWDSCSFPCWDQPTCIKTSLFKWIREHLYWRSKTAQMKWLRGRWKNRLKAIKFWVRR